MTYRNSQTDLYQPLAVDNVSVAARVAARLAGEDAPMPSVPEATRVRVTVELDVNVEALCFAVSEDDFDYLGVAGAAALLVDHVLHGRASLVRSQVFSHVSVDDPEEI